MTPGAHLLASWIIAEHSVTTPRERRIVTLAGLVPDLDGLGVAADLLSGGKTEYFQQFHHILGHSLLAGLVLAGLASLLAGAHRMRVFLVALGAFHLHLICDLVGSKGPDGYQWPLPYFSPFVPGYELAWKGQWLLNGWQNNLILAGLFTWMLVLAARRGRSFAEVISQRLDRELFAAIRRRWR